jgi:hypothetical protein
MDEVALGYMSAVDEVCNLELAALDRSQLTAVAWAYYFFSVQFRENLEVLHRKYPDDLQVQRLVQEECATDNLSPWPGVAAKAEKLNHDEFMWRTLQLGQLVDHEQQVTIEMAGEAYLARCRRMDDKTRVMSIASYECGGLERVFKAILRAPDWNSALLQAFRHFLVKHVGFDSDPEQGHGFLIRHVAPDHRVRAAWQEFRDLLITAVPRLVG